MSEDNSANTFAYLLDGKIYINLTNRCSNDCEFCIRAVKDTVLDKNLWLSSEDVEASMVIAQIERIIRPEHKDVVFCGYGEPLFKLDVLKTVAAQVKEAHPGVKVRINTNGHANLIYKRNVVPELKGLVDEVSVSLNAENEEIYNKISAPKIPNAYAGMKEFTKEGVNSGIKAVMTVVTGYKDYKIDTKACEDIATSLGASFRERPWLDNGY